MDIQDVLNRLHSADPDLANEVRECFNGLTADRDQAVTRAREAVTQAAKDAVAKAKAQLAEEAKRFVHVEQMPKQFILRQEFDRLTPAEKMKTVKAGISIMD